MAGGDRWQVAIGGRWRLVPISCRWQVAIGGGGGG